MICDNLGHIIQVHGPFSSLDYDGDVWDATYADLGLWNGIDDTNPEHSHRYEVVIGDCHYMNGAQCAGPIQKSIYGKMNPLQTQYNNFVGSVRSTIDQVFGYLKTWAILNSVYRGMLLHGTGYDFLCTAFMFCCELYNARFTVLGHNKREMMVVMRDENGTPLCPPANLTPENLRMRDNIHKQLSTFNKLSTDPFFRNEDIDSKNTSVTFKTTDTVWVFEEAKQDFMKATVTGCVDDLYSIRSSNKKTVMTGVHPNIIFSRDKSRDEKPVITNFTREVAPLSNQQSDDTRHLGHTIVTGNMSSNDPVPTRRNSQSNHPMSTISQCSSNDPISSSQCHEGQDMDTNNDIFRFAASEDRAFAISIQNEIDGYAESNIPSEALVNAIELEEDFLEELCIKDLTVESDGDEDSKCDEQLESSTANVCDLNQNEGMSSDALFTGHSWELLSSMPENKTICLSPSGCIPIRKRDAETLLDGRWLNDEVLNFIVESVNSFRDDIDTKYDCCRRPYLCSSWLFTKMFTVSTHGELGRYNFNAIKRFFNSYAATIPTWDQERFCVPANLHSSHWFCCIVKTKKKTVAIVDSIPDLIPKKEKQKIGQTLIRWYKDEINYKKSLIVDPSTWFYISDAELRESAIQGINAAIQSMENGDWIIEETTYWKQSNDVDCGFYTLFTILIHFIGEEHFDFDELSLSEDEESVASKLRLLLLNFLRYKYITKSTENLNPFTVLNLLKKSQ